MHPIKTFLTYGYILLCCGITPLLAASNQNLDSLKQSITLTDDVMGKYRTYDELSYYYRRNDLDSAMHYNAAAFALLKDSTYGHAHARLDYSYGVLYRLKGEFAKSIEYYQKNLDYKQQEKDTLAIAKAYYGIALTYIESRDYESGTEQAFLSRKHFQQSNDAIGEIRILNLIGMALNSSFRAADAMKYFNTAIELANKIGNAEEAAHVYVNLATSFKQEKEYESALKYYRKVLAHDKSVNSKWGEGMMLHSIGSTYNAMGKFDQAAIELKKALVIKKELKHLEEIEEVKSDLGYSLAHTRNNLEGISLIQSSLQTATKNNWVKIIKKNFKQLATAYLVNGNAKQGALYHKKYITFSDSLAKTDMEFKVNELETKFATAEKEQKITLLNTENELKALQLSVAKKRSLLFGLTSLIFAGLLFLLYRLYKKITIQNNEKDILLREIHHRVKNNLQVISSLLRIQSRSVTDEKAKKAILEGRSRVHSMSLIHQNLYRKDNVTGVEMDNYISKLSKDLFETYNVSAGKISIKTTVENIKLDVESVIPIGLIVNELLTNSLKYAFPESRDGEIGISLIEKEKQLILTVQDDGIGMDPTLVKEKTDSFGHSLIRAFKNKLDADIIIAGDNGTTVKLIIKKYIKAA